MQDKDIKSLLERYRNGRATESDMSFLETWYLYPDKESTVDNYSEEFLLRDVTTVWKNLNKDVASGKNSIRILQSKVFKYAAAVVFFLCFPLYFYQHKEIINEVSPKDHTPDLITLNYSPSQTGQGNANEIQLELAHGRIIDLNRGDTARIIAQLGEVTVINQNDEVRYIAANSISTKATAITYHRIKVPYGKRINVELLDGTRISLNSGTELRYPVNVAATDMDLYLKGEGFFDVAHVPGRRFNVHVDGYGRRKDYNVQVLGTQFNIRSFPEDGSSKTTLFEGAIQLTGLSTAPVQLKPLMEVEVEKHFSMQAADLESATAWRNGDFFFKNASLYEVCMELGRWYGVDFQYDKSLENIQFYFNVSRSQPLDHVLKMLAQHEHITIKKNKQIIKITHN